MKRRQVLAALARPAAAAALSGLAAWPARAAPAQPGEPVRWPQVNLLDGGAWSAEQVQGRAVIVVFWSTTCPFCLRHNAHLEKLRRALGERPVRILTVARERDPAAVRAYLARHGYGFAVTLDHAAMAEALSTRRTIPLTVLVDARGRLKRVIPGEMFEEDMMELRDLS
jgi:thiol-disulfide isomerase/thioredoxin